MPNSIFEEKINKDLKIEPRDEMPDGYRSHLESTAKKYPVIAENNTVSDNLNLVSSLKILKLI